MIPAGDESPPDAARAEIALRHSGGLRASLLIGLCCFLVYNANLRSITAGDTYPARYLPFAIVQYHTLFLEPVARVAAQGRGIGAYWLLRRPDGHLLSLYPVAVPVLIAPLYVPAVAYLHLRGWTDARLDHVAKVMEKLAASFLAALSAALLYLLIRRRAGPQVALLLTVAYAFGTTTWMISSQALWQHGLAELLLVGALVALTAPCTAARALTAGLLLGLMAANRPPDVILAAALGPHALLWAGWRRLPLLAAAAAVPLVAVVRYNLFAAGNAGGGYGVLDLASFFQHDLLTGVSGLLISPTKGLLVFSPFLLWLALVGWRLPRSREDRRLLLAMTAAVVTHIVLYAKTDWRGGLSWGPRYMTDLLPFLMWMLVPVAAAMRRAERAGFAGAVAVAVVIEAIGALSYTAPIDMAVYAADRGAINDMRPAFDWRNAAYLLSPGQGFAPPELLVTVRGSFEAIEVDGRATTVITAGQQALVTGWTLVSGRTPAQVAVSIDGPRFVASSTFVARPDLHGLLSTSNLAGWRIPLDTAGLTPGVHYLTAFVWASGKGDGHFLEERTLTVLAAAPLAPSNERPRH